MVDFQLMTSLDLEATFPDDNACKAYLAGRRWQDKVPCPRCGNDKVYALPGFNWQCQACNSKGYRFSVLVGTAFENTKIPLKYWFRIIHMILTSRKNMTVLEVQRNTGLGSNRSSWFLYHRVRRALLQICCTAYVALWHIAQCFESDGWPSKCRPWSNFRASTDL
jgi:predicted RNA-binding Zn-ribbon protein involved in translation (DUF1610 family)